MKWLLVLVVLTIGACDRGERRVAREKYNTGVAALAKGDFDAAVKALLEARSEAGVDPELRFRAAYDLGLAYAAQADKLRRDPKPDLPKALELAQQAASWLADASRQRPGDADTTANLAIVRARVQALADEVRKGEGTLEARIEHAIKEQRGVLDGVREAWLEIKRSGGGDPLAQQGTLTHLADLERAIVAEVGAISDVAADEIDAIGKRPEDKRTDEEKVRLVQLKNIDLYLIESRNRIAEARRELQRLAAEDALGKAETALVALKRAREQLLDPITVLRTIAQDEVEVVRDTATATAGAKLSLQAGTPEAAPPAPAEPPAWLEPAVLAERQGGLRDRLEEVRARLAAATTAPPPSDGAQDPQAAEAAKTIERVAAALPAIGDASTAMDRARQALAERQLAAALEHERAALVALAKAVEQFADLKQTIELAYADQQQIVALLAPEAAKLPVAERSKETRDALARNLARMPRLQALIREELASLAAQEQQLAANAAAPAAGSGSAAAGSGSAGAPTAPPQAQADAAKQQLAAARQQLERAEVLRGEALAALGKLDKALAANGQPVPPATEAQQKLEELRKLFFSVIEHLQQLIRDQGETRDQTSATSGEDEFARAPKLPGLITREDEHASMAKAITDALAQQADAASQQPAPGQAAQPGQPDAKALAAAADEVRLAHGAMTDARGTLAKAKDATQSSESLAPAVKSQATAIEHLENALRLLQPPQPQDQQQQQQQQQQQEQQQQQQPQPQAGAGQAARDQDAQQQRKRRQREASSDNVEKDW